MKTWGEGLAWALRHGWRSTARYLYVTALVLWEDHVLLPLGRWLRKR